MSEQLNNLLQQQLRDVHLPDSISWWPLAMGWWILAVVILALIIVGARSIVRYKKRNRYRKQALAALNIAYSNWQERADSAAYLQSANAILKRTVLHFQAASQNGKLTGQAWVECLAHYGGQALSEATANALAFQCYQAQPEVVVDLIHTELAGWLENHHIKHSLEPNSQQNNLQAQGVINA